VPCTLASASAASCSVVLTASWWPQVQRVSEPAREAIQAAGGRVQRVYYNKLGMRAVLMPEWFQKKERLVPTAVQMVPYKKQWRFDRPGSLPATDAPALVDVLPPASAAAGGVGGEAPVPKQATG
jgi:hypothetical protein